MMKTIRRLLLFVAVLGVSAGVFAADWPTYLHDNTRVGVTDQPLQFPLSLQWQYRSAAPTESAWEGPRSEPIEGIVMKHRVRFDDAHHVSVVSDRVYFGSSVDHQVRCV